MKAKVLAILVLLIATLNMKPFNPERIHVLAPGEPFTLQRGVSSGQTDASLIFYRGKEAKSEHYTGHIFITPGIHKTGYDINHLIFEAGSHNDWHIHPDADQLMLVLDGEGYYQEEGKPKRLVRKGDVIDTKANVKHWHGATPGNRLVHLSVTDHTGKGHIVWLEPVTEEEYNRLPNQ